MFKLFGLNAINSKGSNSRKVAVAKKATKSKTQARKNQPVQAVEFDWLKRLSSRKIALALIVVMVMLAIPFLRAAGVMLPIEKIRISGDFKQLDTNSIEQQLKAFLGQDFFSVDIKLIQRQIGGEPWVETVSVKRIWPNQLNVRVKEKQAVARWDKEHLLSSQAVIFAADSDAFSSLPKINGYSKQTVDLLKRYHRMQQEFSRHGLYIAELNEDRKGALRLLLNNELKVNMGSEDNEAKIKHLLAVYSAQIKPRAEQIKQIDFRYSNGFAIAWKDEYLKQQIELEQRGNNNV